MGEMRMETSPLLIEDASGDVATRTQSPNQIIDTDERRQIRREVSEQRDFSEIFSMRVIRFHDVQQVVNCEASNTRNTFPRK